MGTCSIGACSGPARSRPAYANVRVNGYTEFGDPLLTMTVQGQNLEGLTGSAGAQFRAMLPAGSMPLNAFLNVTAEHDFLDQVHHWFGADVRASIPDPHDAGRRSNDIYGRSRAASAPKSAAASAPR